MSTGPSSNIIIRLQNLPNEARAVDIRRFFGGLSIPDGGVHVVGGEKGDAFINFSSDDDARQAMMKSGIICGNTIKLFLSSRTEMQSVIAQARAAPPPPPSLSTKPVIEPTYSPNLTEQHDQNGNTVSKLPSANAISSILAEIQAKALQQQQQQQQQQLLSMDPSNALLMATGQNNTVPLAIQQLLAVLAEKQQQQQQQIGQPLQFQPAPLSNTVNQYSQPTNGWITPQYPHAFQQQQQRAAAAALLFQQHHGQSSLLTNHSQENNNLASASNSSSSLFDPFMKQSPITADEPYIRVRNIPIGYSYHNIKMMFGKYKLNLADIKIINDQNGQRTGEIVLRLHTNKDVADLLAQDGRIPCLNALLDIKKIDEYTFASVVDSFVPGHVKKAPGATIKNCIRVTGLPKKYERKDVKRFFAGCNVTNRPGGIFIETDTPNGPTFVEFETEIDAEKAFFYNGEHMGSSTVEMYRMTKADMESEINSLKRGPDRGHRRPPLLLHEPPLSNIHTQHRNAGSPHLLPPSMHVVSPQPFVDHHRRYPGSPVVGSLLPTHPYPISMHPSTFHPHPHYHPDLFSQEQPVLCLRLRNIPYSTTEKQIYDYFASSSTPIESCRILLDRFNRCSGEALVRFHDVHLCQIAFESKNRQLFYGRSLELRPITLFEYQQNSALVPTTTTTMMTAADLLPPPMKRISTYYERDDDRRNEKRPRWESKDSDGFLSNRHSPKNGKDEQVHESKPIGSSSSSNDEKKNDRHSTTPPVASATTILNSSSSNLPPLPSELNDYIGRILLLSNVAYRATREEILDFLRSYSPIPDTLKIRCDVNGKPTGFGVVACETITDATRAVAELNNQTFMQRKIFLQQR